MNLSEQAFEGSAQLRVVLDAVPAMVAYVDARGIFRYANRSYESWFARDAHDIVGCRVADVLGPAVHPRVRPHIEAALRGQPVRFETSFPHPDGSVRWVEARYEPHLGGKGEVLGYVTLVSEITKQRQLREAHARIAQRTERLMKITTAIADAVTKEQIYEAVVDQVAAALGASSATLWLCDETHAHVARAVGLPFRVAEQLSPLPVDAEHRMPAIDSIRLCQPLWIETQERLLALYPHLRPLVTRGRQYCVACLPILVGARAIGSLGLTFDDAPPLDGEAKESLLLVARYSAQALERLRLLENEKAERALAQASAARMGVLSRASRAFSEAGADLARLLDTVAREVTTNYADCCAISLLSEEDDVLELVAVHHLDPEVQASIRAALEATPARRGEGLIGQVVVTGRSLLLPVLDAEALRAVHPKHKAWVDRHAPRGMVMVPLRVRGGVIGVLTVIRHEGQATFVAEDADLLQDLADRAALAIDGAKLHRENERARQRAERLHNLAQSVIRAEDITQIYEAALDAIESALGTHRCSILVLDAEGVMRFRAWRGLSFTYRQAVEGHSPWPREARAPEPVWVPDARQDPAMAPHAAVLEAEGIAALAFIPLVAGETLLGKFMVYFQEPHRFGAVDTNMARAIANHVSTAIARFSALAELQQTVRFNEMFTAMLGHDLRNPLAAIMTATQVAVRRDEGGTLEKPLSRVLSSGRRMARMIDQLLDFARVRVGNGIPIAPGAHDLATLLRQVIDELEGAAAQSPVELEVLARDTLGQWDHDRLLQVFSNLVANALQHGAPGHPVRVRVFEAEDEGLCVDVHNHGDIPVALLPSLFEPMAGGDRRHDKSQGLGLGLYISREIVRAHGGHIQVQSSQGEGTTFVVCLPRVTAACGRT